VSARRRPAWKLEDYWKDANDERFLPALAQLIEQLSRYRRGDCPAWLANAARVYANRVTTLHLDWQDGAIRTLDEGIGLTRPRNWNQAAHLKRATKGREAAREVVRRISAGAKTPHVFDDVAEALGMKAREVSKAYYALPESSRIRE
jgi:hypothetical protein